MKNESIIHADCEIFFQFLNTKLYKHIFLRHVIYLQLYDIEIKYTAKTNKNIANDLYSVI